YRLQLASTATGTANALTVDTSVFSAQLGSLNTLTSAADATITVGKGSPNQCSVTSGSNTVTGVLPGVTLTLLQADPTSTVTINADGTIAFDSSKFADAYAKHPAAVAALFQQTGKQTAGSGLSFSSATDTTRTGSYAVVISQVATQASYSGTGVVGGTVGATG